MRGEKPVKVRGTTVIAVKRGGKVVVGADGQVTFGDSVLKRTARKVRRIFDGKVIVGFAGAAADGLALMERLETKLRESNGNLQRAVISLAKEWRSDKVLRRLEALIIVTDGAKIFLVSGGGEILEPEEDVIAIGSGGNYALAAAKALLRHTDMSAEEIAREALNIASEIDIYTNKEVVIDSLEVKEG